MKFIVNLGDFLFKYRSYTPIIPLIIMLAFCKYNVSAFIIGIFVSLAGQILRLWALSYAGGATRTVSMGAPELITGGPFGHVRNPLYQGNLLLTTGILISSNTLFPYYLIAGIFLFFIQYMSIILKEESFLASQFKEEFVTYSKAVPRWGWNFRNFNISKKPIIKGVFELTKIERRSLQSLIIVYLLFAIIFFMQGKDYWWR
ncbi:MAG: isoprenylcysteine carboxylmethyltransferase family protein [Candidatus Coatesbacteria bacterium]|nr:isoprenylcysteine carboxylmethyltransferase family protein [Candidatus Coatesbacteria bacterium]